MPIGYDKVKICNMALSHVGSKTTIESIDERSPQANICKLWYDTARLQTLEAFNWPFARKSKALATHAVAAPEYRWLFRYQLPSDCVAARLIENPAGRDANAVPYEIENAGDGTLSIVTNQENAVLLYTFDTAEVPLFPLKFVEAMALALAGRIAYKISGKTSLVKSLSATFDAAILAAEIAAIETSIPPEEREAATIRARS